MKKKIYIIRQYKMTDSTFYTHELLPIDDEITSIKYLDNGDVKEVSYSDCTYTANNYFSLSEKPKGYPYGNPYLPYAATVTEDLPGSAKGLKPKVYENCQLMSEKHGGYLQFWHEPTKQVLRIAMNSHIYSPQNN